MSSSEEQRRCQSQSSIQWLSCNSQSSIQWLSFNSPPKPSIECITVIIYLATAWRLWGSFVLSPMHMDWERALTPCLWLAGPVGHEHKVLIKLWSLAYRCGRKCRGSRRFIMLDVAGVCIDSCLDYCSTVYSCLTGFKMWDYWQAERVPRGLVGPGLEGFWPVAHSKKYCIHLLLSSLFCYPYPLAWLE